MSLDISLMVPRDKNIVDTIRKRHLIEFSQYLSIRTQKMETDWRFCFKKK